MRKFLVLSLAVLIPLSSLAENVVKHHQIVSGVRGLSVSAYYNVNLKKGPASVSTTASSEIAEYVVVKVENGIIKLGLDQDKMPRELRKKSKWTLSADVSVPELETLSLSGAVRVNAIGNFYVNDLDANMSGASSLTDLYLTGIKADFDISGASSVKMTFDMKDMDFEASGASNARLEGKTDDLSLDCSGASHMEVKGQFTEVDVECSGASKVNISGKSRSSELECSGASTIDGLNLESETADVDASGASSISANVSRKVMIELSGASSLEYKASSSAEVVKKSIGKGCSLKAR